MNYDSKLQNVLRGPGDIYRTRMTDNFIEKYVMNNDFIIMLH